MRDPYYTLCVLQRFPDKELPALCPAMLQLYDSSLALARTILEMMGHALKLEVRGKGGGQEGEEG